MRDHSTQTLSTLMTVSSTKPTPLKCTRQLLIRNETADLNDLDDPLQAHQTDRAPLTGNISSSNPISQSYLTSSIPGEDRRAPMDTLDESVWATLSRDLRAVWEKMRLVLWPKYLLGGVMNRGGGGLEAGQAEGDGLSVRGLMQGHFPVDADTVLQANMTEGLRDWDLWFVLWHIGDEGDADIRVGDHYFSASSSVYSSLFARRLIRNHWFSLESSQLCGSEKPSSPCKSSSWEEQCLYTRACSSILTLTDLQLIFPVCVHHWLHSIPARDRVCSQRIPYPCRRADTGLHCPGSLGVGSRCQHPRRVWRPEEQGWYCSIPFVRLLRRTGLSLPGVMISACFFERLARELVCSMRPASQSALRWQMDCV